MSLFKVIFLGKEENGKTALVNRICDNTFTESYVSTVGVDFATKDLIAESGETVNLKLWDTAGADRFQTITTSYYRGVHLIVIVLDLTDSFCLENAERYLQNCDNFCNGDVLKILVGTKSDLAEKRLLLTTTAEEFAAENGNIPYIEVSSKDGTNIEGFTKLAMSMLIEQENAIREKKDKKKQKKRDKKAKKEDSKQSKMCHIL